MNLHIIAVGAIKRGPERELVDDYIARANRLAGSLGVRRVAEAEVASGGGPDAEADRLLERCQPGAHLILLDEHGEPVPSKAFAAALSQRRDRGEGDVCFLIGGAEGHGGPARAAAHQRLALGPQTWPHKLARVMLAEQLYRALTILAGTPYHKA